MRLMKGDLHERIPYCLKLTSVVWKHILEFCGHIYKGWYNFNKLLSLMDHISMPINKFYSDKHILITTDKEHICP